MQLIVKDLNKSFNDTQVLKDINLHVNSGQIYGYLGRNGAGKTTSMRILMDVFEGDSGSITLDGKKFRPADHLIGYLPEERGMYAKVKISEQLLYFAELRGANRQQAKESIKYWSKKFGIDHYLEQKLETLSKGNQQKVQITQAFISEPDILILDEPFSGLDPVNSKIFQDALLDYIREDRIIIFSSHQMSYVESFCDDIAIIKEGQIVLEGNLKDIKEEMGADRLRVQFGKVNEQDLEFLTAYDYMLEGEDIILSLLPGQKKEDFIREILDQQIEINLFMDYLPSLQEIFIQKAGIKMKQFKTVFKFELLGLLKNKSLLITTAIMMIIAVIITSIPTFMGFFGNDEEDIETDESEQVEESYSIVYASDELEELMADILGEAAYANEKELKEAIKNKEIETGFVIEDLDQYQYISYDRSLDSYEQMEFESQLEQINENYLFEQEGMDSERIYEIINTPIQVDEVILGRDTDGSGTIIAFAIIFIMYMLILLYGNNVATSVAKEKDSRTMELLITSTKPKTLILGKVAAVGLTGVLQIGAIILAGFIGFFLNKGNYPALLIEMMKDTMSLDTLAVYFLFSISGYLLYLFIYASLGSLVSKVEDVAKSTAPITYLFIIAYFAATMAMNMPDNSIIRITSFIPFVSMFTMPIRYMMTTVPLISVLVSILIMILTVILFAGISIYIYRFGSLNYGNRLTLKEVIKSVKRN